MKIFLTGFMGCGKSRRGKELAAHLQWPFIDIDAVLVEAAGMDINSYFAEFGEAAFRELESQTLKTYDYPENAIVAVGGGLPCYFDNMDWMNANGTTVYLKMDPAALVSRLHNRQKRPLIKDMDDDALLQFIQQKLKEREPYYAQAQFTMEGLGLKSETIADELGLGFRD